MPLELPEPLDTGTLTPDIVSEMMNELIRANEAAVRQQRAIEANMMIRQAAFRRKPEAVLIAPRETFYRLMRKLEGVTYYNMARAPENVPNSLWGFKIRTSEHVRNPVMEVNDGVRSVAMHLPNEALDDPNLLQRIQRELEHRLDYEFKRAGDEDLTSTALKYDFFDGRRIKRGAKVRSLVYEKED